MFKAIITCNKSLKIALMQMAIELDNFPEESVSSAVVDFNTYEMLWTVLVQVRI